MTENSNSNDDNGAGQIATTDDLFGWPGDGVHWTWQRCGRYEYRKVLMHSTNPGSQRGAWERRVPPGSRPVRGREEAMQYHQLRILCALRDKIAENDKSLTGHQAKDRARARMTRLGSGSRELFDLEGPDG